MDSNWTLLITMNNVHQMVFQMIDMGTSQKALQFAGYYVVLMSVANADLMVLKIAELRAGD